jgi:hypothetical protein
MNLTCHFLYIYCLDFCVKKIFLLPKPKKILWGNKFLKVPPRRNVLVENQNNFCFLWDLGLWILTTQPSHSYTLAYCRHVHLIFVEFQNIDNNPCIPPKTFFFSFNCYYLAIYVITFVLQTIRIVEYKILRLKVKKYHFILFYHTYVFET